MKSARLLARLLGAVMVLAPCADIAVAQTYPTRPIRLLVPFAPGGIFDYIGRLVTPRLSETLGQSVVVDNRAGGGGVIAMQLAGKATPDGHTILLADPSLVNNLHLHAEAPYALKDLAPVTILTTASLVLAVNSKVPAQSVQELIELARTGKLNYGSAGVGSTPHMAAELFKGLTKADMTHVPFKGVGPAVTALVAGQVQVLFGSVAGTASFIKDGRLRGLATTGEKRSAALPELRTLAEAGYPGSEVLVWGGIFVPTGTPKPIITQLNAEFRKLLLDPEVKAGLEKVSIEPLGTSPEAAAAFVRREYEKWGKVIKAAGIRAE